MKKGIEYLPRISDKLLDRKLHTSGAVLITGCKWCGKTMSAEQFAESVIYMQDPDKSATYLAMADTKPSLLLEGAERFLSQRASANLRDRGCARLVAFDEIKNRIAYICKKEFRRPFHSGRFSKNEPGIAKRWGGHRS